MLACFGWVYSEIGYALANHPVLPSLSIQESLGTALTHQLLVFALTAWAVHALVGFLALALARLTESAFPRGIGASRSWLVTGWFVLLIGLTMAANTTWHPSSQFAGDPSWWQQVLVGTTPLQIAAATVALFVLVLVIRAALHLRISVPAALLGALVASGGLFLLWSPPSIRGASALADTSAPHIVILGIDSLRNDLTIPRRGEAATPAVDHFLAHARRFSDAVSPLPRTYGAWVSILTGRHPVSTNARVNLMPRKLVHEGVTLPEVLHAQGYRTFYATDEVRFANIDRSFGFDKLVTPPIGAADFLLGYAGDMPLINLVASLPIGRWLFPATHANRAANVTYHPEQFLQRLEQELDVQGPSFLAIHLTLAHWPYAWAGKPVPTRPDGYREAYGDAVAEVDRQFRDVMQLLADKGVLDNAIVVLLSDHGEALGAENDSMLRKVGTSREVWDSLWGHGTSVMSPPQYQVLFAIRAFGRAQLPGPSQDYDWPISLEDLRPTLEHFATGKAPADVDGISLVPFLEDPMQAKALASRIRFTETDFNTPSTLAGRYEASGIIDEAATYYELDRESGWVQFREDRLPELIARKQRAAMSSTTLLAAIPGPPGRGHRYLLTDRRNPAPRALEGPPDPSAEPEARRLWDALQARFPGELPAGAKQPRM